MCDNPPLQWLRRKSMNYSCCIVVFSLFVPGCIPPLPVNVGAVPEHVRVLVERIGDAGFFEEEGLEFGSWLEVDRVREAGVVGGYFRASETDSGSLIVCLPGASSFYDGGMVAKVRDYHLNFLAPYQEAGFATWALAVRECGSPYGEDDLADLREALDWLEREGKAQLGVERVYLLGYSSGSVLVALANLEYELDGVITLSGLMQPDHLEQFRGVYLAIAALYPENAGLCQFGDTLREYGPAGSAAWGALDVVGRVGELRNPMLVVHGERDLVYPVENALALQEAQDALAAMDRPEIEFFIPARGNHLNVFDDPEVVERVLEFLRSH